MLRQQGLEAVPPGQGKARPGKMPRRGQVWPAVVDDIALPESFARVELMEVSETAASFLSKVEETMLRPATERDAIKQAWERDGGHPYMDPGIEENMLALAVRMAKGGMLRGVRQSKCSCGLFTVVKAVEEATPEQNRGPTAGSEEKEPAPEGA